MHFSLVPKDAEIFKGPKGGLFFMQGDKKIFITDRVYQRTTNFKPRRGAFLRFIENQASNV
jgi:hypothetical protein